MCTGSDTLVHALMNHLEDMCPVGGPGSTGDRSSTGQGNQWCNRYREN